MKNIKNDSRRRCKSCGRILVDGYKYRRCGYCRTKQANLVRKIGIAVIAIIALAMLIGVISLTTAGIVTHLM